MQSEESTIAAGQFVVSLNDGTGDRPDYIVLPVEEPIKANIVDIRPTPGKFANDDGVIKDQLKFTFKVAPGQEGEGQSYGHWVNAPTSNSISPKSNIFKIASKVYKEFPANLDLYDMLGKPVRIELREPNDSGYQYIAAIKSPTADQKPVAVSKDTVVAAGADLDDVIAQMSDVV